MTLNISKVLIISILFLQCSKIYCQSATFSEADYSNQIQLLIGGKQEVVVEGGRVDLLTDEYVGFPETWPVKIRVGQAR